MDALMMILPVILYVLGIILIVVLIVLGLRLIETINRANDLLDDLEKKSKSLNGVFNIIDTVTDRITLLSNTVVDSIVTGISKIFNKRKNKKEIDEDE